MKKDILTLLLFIISISLFSQTSTIFGYISDRETGERLIGATIYDSNTNIGSTSNSYGFYSIKMPKNDTIILTVSFVGYKSYQKTIILKENKELNISLSCGAEIDEVWVVAQRNIPTNDISTHKISMEHVKSLPSLGGEKDLIKALQLLPGVQSGNEGSSGLYVRGGSGDQNLMLLDGVPLYYVNHLGGFVSVFNPDAINSVTLIKGGFPARYGNRLSSIVDIRMNEGNMKKHTGSATIGMISSKISVEGPIKKDTASYIISVRRLMYDLFSKPISYFALDGFMLGYYFYDVNAKINYKISHKDRFYLSFYNGKDKLSSKMKNSKKEKIEFVEQWGNILTSMRWSHLYRYNLFSNITLYHTKYNKQTDENYIFRNDYSKSNFISNISDFGLLVDFEYNPLNEYRILLGGSSVYHKYKPSSNVVKYFYDGVSEVNTFKSNTPEVFESSFYIENQIDISSFVELNLGLRYSYFKIEEQNYFAPEPRFSMNFNLNKNNSLRFAYSIMQQNVHMLTTEGLSMPIDYWLPVTKKMLPEKAEQFSLGFFISNELIDYSIEAYYKKMSNLISFKEGHYSLNFVENWEEKVENNGVGKSYGIEGFIKKDIGKSTGWLSYTFSKTNRKFENINSGKSYPFKYDRRHDFNAVYLYKISDNIDVSATWVYGTGNAITLGYGQYLAIDNYLYFNEEDKNIVFERAQIYGDKNSFRMRSYHKLDLGLNIKKQKKRGERIWSFSIYNAYNRQNPYFYFWDTDDYFDDEQYDGKLKLYQSSLFPIMPSVSYTYNF